MKTKESTTNKQKVEMAWNKNDLFVSLLSLKIDYTGWLFCVDEPPDGVSFVSTGKDLFGLHDLKELSAQ